MKDVEQALRELHVEWPATPDLAGAVSARIAAEATAPAPGGGRLAGRRSGGGLPRRRSGRRGLAWPRFARPRLAAVAAALLVLAGGTLAVPEARSTVFRWLGLSSVEIRREPPRPVPGASLGLGPRTTLEALRRDGRPVLVPRELGDPPGVYATILPAGTPAASLVYEGPILVQTFRASAEPFIEKTVGAASGVERLTLGERTRGYWITGAHGFAYGSAGGVGYEDQRVADQTLLVQRGDLLLRVEGPNLTRDEAIAIAASVQ